MINMSGKKYKESLGVIAKGAGISFLFGVLGYAITLVMRLLLARYYGPEGYGQYELVSTFLGALLIISSLGVTNGVSRYIPYYLSKEDYYKLKGYLSFIISLPLLFSLLISIFFIIYAGKITAWFNFPYSFSTLLVIIGYFIPIKVLTAIFSAIFKATKNIFVSELGEKVLNRGVLLIFVLIVMYLNLNLEHFILFFGISMLVSLIYYLISFRKLKVFKAVKSLKIEYSTREWVNFSLPLFFVGMFGYILGWSDNFIIGYFLSAKELGIYGIAFSLSYYLFFILNAFIGIFQPVLAELMFKNKEIYVKTFNKIRDWVLLITLLPTGLMLFYGGYIIEILFGVDYLAGAKALSILSGFFLLSIYLSFYNATLIIMKDTTFTFFSFLVSSIVNVILGIFLIQDFGINGIAFSSGLSLLFLYIIQMFRSHKFMPVRINVLSIFKQALSISFALFGLEFFFRLSFLTIGKAYILIIGLIIYFSLYFVFLILFRYFSEDDVYIIELIEKKVNINLDYIKKIL